VYQVASLESFFGKEIASYQNYNASTAFLVAKTLAAKNILPMTEERIRQGILSFSWPGRWQKIALPNGTTLILESAHNEEGAFAIYEAIRQLPEKPTMIFGSNTAERATKMLNILAPLCQEIVFTSSSHKHALDAETFLNCLADVKLQSKRHFQYIGLDQLISFVHNSGVRVILVTGSLYLVGDVMRKGGLK
jgi:folylpolyglutamate synthase/dihydropteroate synthase